MAVALERVIHIHYAPVSDAAGRPAYSWLLLVKTLLVGVLYGGLSDERVESMANDNLSVMRFLCLCLEDDVFDHSVLSRFRTCLTEARAWDGLLDEVNRQFDLNGVNLKRGGVHVDASLTIRPRKPKHRPTYGDLCKSRRTG
ncbi:MAG: transposase [Methylophilaceae bacterium]|nr:transposase [Methylophilaceae bacterium]